MVTDYLKYLGFDEKTIQTLPEDIMNAAIIYDGLQKIYMDIPTTDVWKKESFAKAIALGTRNLLIRINFLVNNPQGVVQNVAEQITQLPKEIKPQEQKEEAPSGDFGLKIGDKLPEKVIGKWADFGNNFIMADEKTPIWQSSKYGFIGDREITGFRYFDEVVNRYGIERIDKVLGFQVSGTDNVFLRAEGFKNFMENFEDHQPNPIPTATKPSSSPKPSKPVKPKPTRSSASSKEKQNELSNKLKNIEF